ncbi:uncharacterized protein MELLADRAFT_63191 [Melampsora larici-populina 98AG31]|uniref:Uncharacterized protein n=1 Tax=Melampsora larici-populina (strain 98AG31 / pathotype 3-4-7) TaxID=747676 RepID=F4RLR8_MELLP|nr:uncharacterized protein MELLADRAFT_63191 [Melampsora larici-populina 98AG31]EGG06705.1 hypothetical protein MELLADRAFT_63191 [Melampsora larici-populina 98AG31]
MEFINFDAVPANDADDHTDQPLQIPSRIGSMEFMSFDDVPSKDADDHTGQSTISLPDTPMLNSPLAFIPDNTSKPQDSFIDQSGVDGFLVPIPSESKAFRPKDVSLPCKLVDTLEKQVNHLQSQLDSALRDLKVLKAECQYLSVETSDLNSTLHLNQIRISGHERVLRNLLGTEYMEEAYNAPRELHKAPDSV